MAREPESVVRRIVVEYGKRSVYVYWTDGNGKLIDEEVWQQPMALPVKEVHEEAEYIWQVVYQEIQDTVLWSASDADEGGTMEPDAED